MSVTMSATDSALSGYFEAIPEANSKVLELIVEDPDNKYTAEFRQAAADELKIRSKGFLFSYKAVNYRVDQNGDYLYVVTASGEKFKVYSQAAFKAEFEYTTYYYNVICKLLPGRERNALALLAKFQYPVNDECVSCGRHMNDGCVIYCPVYRELTSV